MCCHLFVCAWVFKTCHVFHILYVTSQLPLSHMHMIMVCVCLYSDLFLSGSAWQLWLSQWATSQMHSLTTGNHGSKKPSDCADSGDSALVCSPAPLLLPGCPSLLWLADSSHSAHITEKMRTHSDFLTHTHKTTRQVYSASWVKVKSYKNL